MRRLHWLATTALLTTGLLCVALTPEGRSAPDRELTEQKDRQKQIQSDTDRLVRRIETMIRVYEYNRLDSSSDKELLEQVNGILTGLSKEQMTALIAALEKAQKEKGEARTDELKKAQARHAEIIDGLKTILARFDAVRSLDQAAERLDKMAADQVELFLGTAQLPCESENAGNKRTSALALRVERLANEQGFIKKDFADVVTQVAGLNAKLPDDQKKRAKEFADHAKNQKVADGIDAAARGYKAAGTPEVIQKAWHKSADEQWRVSGELLALARVLRPVPDKLSAMREARQKLVKVIEEETALKADVVNPPKREGGDLNNDDKTKPNKGMRLQLGDRENPRLLFGRGLRGGNEAPVDAALAWGKEVGDRQGWLEHATRAIRGGLGVHLPELAAKLEPAEKDVREAQAEARAKKPADDVVKHVDPALAKLEEVKKELDRLLEEEEKSKNDPLTNLKDALEKLERLIAEQKQLRDEPKEKPNQDKANPKASEQATKQAELAKQTEAVNQQVPNAQDKAKAALDKANEAMQQAAKSLAAQQKNEATPKQEQALKGLEEARKALAEEVEKAEQRRDDIKKLEDADKKLDDLIKAERGVADKAKDTAEKAKAAEDKSKAEKATPKDAKDAKDAKDKGDSKFVLEAANGGMMEVKLGELAKERAAASDVRKFGERMVTDHSKANKDLAAVAEKKGIKLPAELDKKHQEMVDKFKDMKGAEFDRAYMKAMVKDHEEDAAAFAQEAKSGTDDDVKAFAAKTLPVIQDHLKMAKEIWAKMEKK